MSEVEVYQPKGDVVLASDIDSWTQVAGQVIKLSNEIADTPFVPDGLRGSVPAVAAAILTGRELGLPPLTSLANIHVIKGKPALSAVLMRALVQAQGHQWQDVEVTDTRAVVRARRRGEAEWSEAVFTADQAKRAGINLGGYPQDKLYARATARLARRKFADVIAGMPYSAEELEDGFTEDETPAATPAPPAEQKPRTARRRTRTADTPPASAAPPVAETPADAGGALPPLPGEEETSSGPSGGLPSNGPEAGPDDTDYDTPGTVTPRQLTAIWTILGEAFHFGYDEKDQARAVCAHIIGRELESSKNLSGNEAGAVLDTLAHWQHQAEQAGEDPRAWMITLMAGADEAGDGQ